jgi:hypothetical protein
LIDCDRGVAISNCMMRRKKATDDPTPRARVIVAPLLLALAVGACASQGTSSTQWNRAGADDAARTAAINECRSEADAELAEADVRSPRYSGYIKSYGIGPGQSDRSQVKRLAAGDIAANLRGRYRDAFRDCMESAGFELAPANPSNNG